MFKWIHRGVVCILTLMAVGVAVEWAGLGIESSLSNLPTAKQSVSYDVTISEFCVIVWRFYLYQTADEWPEGLDVDLLVCQYSRDSRPASSHVNPPWVMEMRTLRFPNWFVILMALCYPIFFTWRSVRRRRLRFANGCKHCNYDLTGNESGICPECGEASGAKA